MAQSVIPKLSEMIERGKEIVLDGWVNVALGYGTSRDKTAGGSFSQGMRLQDEELRSLYAHDDVAAKIVNGYPREAMRGGYELTGYDDSDQLKKASEYLDAYNCKSLVLEAAIWSRLFGGGKIWVGTDDGALPSQPMLQPPKKIAFLRFFDRRWLTPHTWYEKGPKVGLPETYMLTAISGQTAQVGVIHETRLIHFGGARTELLAKREMNGWDYSVLQVAYDAIRSSGNVWKSIELLIADANQGVFSIKGLWSMIGGKKGDELKARVTLMDLTRSVARSILVDKDNEEFHRESTTFTGLADLDDRAMRRVARAAEYPVSMIGGEQPKGLNASGDSELMWFWARVSAYAKDELEPPILTLYRFILGQEGSPLSGKDLYELGLKWCPLWQPTAKEKAEIDKLKADTAQVAITAEMVLPEEAALSLYAGEEPGLFKIEAKPRQDILKGDLEELLRPPEPDPSELPPPAPGGKALPPGKKPPPADGA